MICEMTARGFFVVKAEKYQDEPGQWERLIQESSVIGDYEDAIDKPGSSFLWVGDHHHLNREEVRELVERMQHWLNTGRLAVDVDTSA